MGLSSRSNAGRPGPRSPGDLPRHVTGIAIATLAVVCGCTQPLGAQDSTGQVRVRSVRMVADLAPDDGAAEVHMEYELDVRGPAPLRFELLGFGDATAPGFFMGGRETGTPVMLEVEQGSMRSGDYTINLGPAPASIRLEARYLIRSAVERDGERLRVHVPVLVVAAPPADDVGDVFHAEVHLPDAWRVSEGFPTRMARSELGAWVVELPVVPSVVSMRARADGRWRPGLPQAIDLIAALILVAFSAFGWRHLRGVAGRAADRVGGAEIRAGAADSPSEGRAG